MIRMSAHQAYRPDDKRQKYNKHNGVFNNTLTVLP
jgi:hypothetical protein